MTNKSGCQQVVTCQVTWADPPALPVLKCLRLEIHSFGILRICFTADRIRLISDSSHCLLTVMEESPRFFFCQGTIYVFFFPEALCL